MAFGANQIWDVRYTGSDANGGGFNPANSNFATDGTVDASTGNTASPVFSSASYNFVTADEGAWLFIKSGTNSIPGWYQIASVASNKATLTASIGSACEMVNNTPVRLNTAAGIATVGTPTGLTWGVDYSQQDAAKLTFTDMVIDGTTNTKFTSAGNPVGKNFIGNTINITSGTGFTVQRVEVVSTVTTTATCDKSLGTLSSTGGNGVLGGSLGTPGMAGGVKIAGNDIFWKYNASAYTLTTNSSNVSGGIVSDTTGGVDQTNLTWWVGYNTTRTLYNSDANWPTLNAGAQNSVTLISITGTYIRARNIIVDGNGSSTTSVTGFNQNGSYQKIDHIKAQNCEVVGIDVQGGNGVMAFCLLATACSGTAAIRASNGTSGVVIYASEAWANTIHGFVGAVSSRFINCISSGNTGASTDGFSSSSIGMDCINCVSYGNGRNGFDASTSIGNQIFINCIAEGNSASGWSTGAVRGLAKLLNCAGYNNTSGNYTATNVLDVTGFVAQSAGSFFTNAASGDFSLNNTSGQGALLRAAGYPGVMPRGLTTGYLDIGAAQHQDAGGSGGVILGNMSGGFRG